jgi:hypothetical protein
LFDCFAPGDHSKITELLQQASTQVLFLYFKHLRSYGRDQESSQLDKIAGDENNGHDTPNFNKTMFCVITFTVHEDIGTCIDYCGTQPNDFSHYTTRAPANYEVRGCGLMNLLLHITQCIGWIVSVKLDTYLICPTGVSNFYRRLGFKHDPTMSSRNELEPFCIRFDLTNLTDLKLINPMSIKGKVIKRKVEKLYDGRWRYILPHDKAIITESHPDDDFFPHDYISNAIDEDMKRTSELLGRDSCDKYLRPYLDVMEGRDPRGLLSIRMKSRYWIAFFIRTFTAWAQTQGKKQHHFDRCMEKTISGNLPRFETACLKHWNYSFHSALKRHQFQCTQCYATIDFERCNSFDSAHLLVTALRLHVGLKIPSTPYVGHLYDINHIEYMKPCTELTGLVFEGFRRCLITDRHKEETGDEFDNDLFVFQFANLQYMLFRMMTYIEKAHCAREKMYYERLVEHYKAILKRDKSPKTVTSKGGREMYYREAKEHLAVDKEIALVDKWGWKGRSNLKPMTPSKQKEKWVQSEVRAAVSMFADLRFQSTCLAKH